MLFVRQTTPPLSPLKGGFVRRAQEAHAKAQRREKSEKWQVKSVKAKRAVAYPFRGRAFRVPQENLNHKGPALSEAEGAQRREEVISVSDRCGLQITGHR